MNTVFIDKVKQKQKQNNYADIPFSDLIRSSYFHTFLQGYLTSLCSSADAEVKLQLVGEEQNPEIRLSRLDGDVITINVDHELIREFTAAENRVFTILGLMFHEVSHLFWMDLRAENECIRDVLEGHLPFEERYLKEHPYTSEYFLRAVRYEPFRPMFAEIYRGLADVISDYHDEEALCKSGGILLRKGIRTLREAQFAKARSLEEMLSDEEVQPFSMILALILQYARYGSVFILNESGRRGRVYVSFLRRIRPDLDAALRTDSVEEKYLHLNAIVAKLWPMMHIEPPDKGSESGLAQTENETEFLFEMDEEHAVFEAEDGERAQEDPEPETREDENAQSESGHGKNPHKAMEYEEEGGSSGTGEDSEEDAENRDLADQITQGMDQAGGQSFSERPSRITEGSPAAHRGADAASAESAVSDLTDGADPVAQMSRMMDRIRESMLEERIESEAADEVVSDALVMIHNGNQFSSHKGILPHLIRARATETDREAYETIVKRHLSFIKKTEREIRKIIQEDAAAQQRRRMAGREIDTRNLYRLDQRYFRKKKNPEKQLDMAVAILVDNSGSMRGRRLASAKEAAVLLTEVLERLGIPTMIAGHNCQDVPQICFFRMFEDQRTAKYAICGMKPDGNNRDGLAIEVVTRFLLDRDEKDRLFLIISDGQPNASGYTGEPARQDIRQIVRRLKTEGIKTIAFAIGDDKEQIRSIYGEAFVDITDQELFPKTFSKLIEKEIINRYV